MYYTGFADEAGASLDVQIKATKELGGAKSEARAIEGVNIHDISDEKFDEVDKIDIFNIFEDCNNRVDTH